MTERWTNTPEITIHFLSFLLMLLVTQSLSKSEEVNKTRLEMVRSFRKMPGEVCLRCLGGQNKEEGVTAVLRLTVISTAKKLRRTAGNCTITSDLLCTDTWHTLIFSNDSDNGRHSLKTEMDGNKTITYNKSDVRALLSVYRFHVVELMIKGRAELSDCQPPDVSTASSESSKRTLSSLFLITLVISVVVTVVMTAACCWYRYKIKVLKSKSNKPTDVEY